MFRYKVDDKLNINSNINYENTIDTTLDNYYINPYKFKYTDNKMLNHYISDNDSLNSIINALTSIIMSNECEKNLSGKTNIPINNTTHISINNKSNNNIFKLIAQNNIEQINKLIKNSNTNINIQDSDGDTPLHIAVFLCNYEICSILLENNANINIQDKWGQSSLHRLCFCFDNKNNYNNILNIIKMYDKFNDSQKNIFNLVDNFGNTPTHIILKYLIKNKINIDVLLLKIINKLVLLTDNTILNNDSDSIDNFINLIDLK